MKWKTKPRLKTGDKRTAKLFAWFPKKLRNGTTIWLESYLQEQKFHEGEYNWAGTVKERGWYDC